MAQPKSNKPVISLVPDPDTHDEVDSVNPTHSNHSDEVDALDERAIDETFAALKTLLGTVDKLQKARQSVGDIKPSLMRLLDGEMLADEEIEQMKAGIGGLGKLAKLYSEYQTALTKAQPARELLDRMIKPQKAPE
ncbi:MAG: hypothetical protein AAFQ89_05875 [Cyanobacteria bacterium J06626_18]